MSNQPTLSKPRITVEQLDSLMSWVEAKPIGKVEAFFALIQLVAVFAYVWARSKLEEKEAALAKQQAEATSTVDNQNELSHDSLDNQ